jgi:hypothetical protein
MVNASHTTVPRTQESVVHGERREESWISTAGSISRAHRRTTVSNEWRTFPLSS